MYNFFHIYSFNTYNLMVTYMNENGYMNNGIRISYPRTKYFKLNLYLKEKIENVILDFMNQSKKAELESVIYTLDISYDDYSYEEFESFVFFISMYLGGAHPNNLIFTVNYDTKNDKFIDIDTLSNDNFLTTLSNEAHKVLINNPSIIDQKMLEEGLTPIKDNFKNIIFTPNGFKIFIPQYQIAPYSSGSFQVVIPYSKIKNNS